MNTPPCLSDEFVERMLHLFFNTFPALDGHELGALLQRVFHLSAQEIQRVALAKQQKWLECVVRAEQNERQRWMRQLREVSPQ